MHLGKLWLTLIPLALLALGISCGQTPAPMPTVQPAPTATVTPLPAPTAAPALTPTPTAKAWPTHWPTRVPKPTPTHPPSPEPTSTPFPRGTPPYPFPEETLAIGDLTGGDSPFVLYGCLVWQGRAFFTHTGNLAVEPSKIITSHPVAAIYGFESPSEILEEGHCYKMVVTADRGVPLRFTTDITKAKATQFNAFYYDLTHPNMWRWCGRAPLPDLADTDC